MELTYIDSVSDVTGSVENLTDEKKQHKKVVHTFFFFTKLL